MRKTKALILIVVICLSIFLLHKNDKNNNAILLGDSHIIGDVDNNGTVGINDYLLIKKHLLNLSKLTGTKLTYADVDGNGSIGISDYLAVKKIILGLVYNNSGPISNSAPSNAPIANASVGKVDFTVKIHPCDSAEITVKVPSTIKAKSYSLDNKTWTTKKTFTVKKDGSYKIYVKDKNGIIYESVYRAVKLIPDGLKNGKINSAEIGLKKGKGTEKEAINNSVSLNEALFCAHKIGVTELILEKGSYYFGPTPKGTYYYAPKSSFQGDEFIRVSNPNLTLDLNKSTLYVYPNNIPNYRLIRVKLNEDLIPPDGKKYEVYIKNGTLIGDRNEHKCIKSNKLLKAECAYNYAAGYKGYYGTVCKSDDLPSHQSGVGIDIVSNNVTIWKMTIKDMTADGIYIANQGTYDRAKKKMNYDHTTLIDRNTISNCRRDGISVILGKNIKITNNTIYGMNGTESEVGIDLERNTEDQYQENVTISGNTIYGNAGRASVVIHADIRGYLNITKNKLGDQIVYHTGHDTVANKANPPALKIIKVSGNTKYTASGVENCVCDVNKAILVNNSYAAILCSGCTRKICDAKSVLKNTWFPNNFQIYYLGADGKKVTGPTWQQVGGYWYYIGSNGGAVLTGWQSLTWSGGTDWFYFNEKGVMQTGWKQITWSGGTHWFYFDSDGFMYANKTVKIGNESFTFDKNGACVKGRGC